MLFNTSNSFYNLIKSIPPLLNWFILDANFLGNSKDDCTGDGAAWVFIKVWFNRFMYGLYPDPGTMENKTLLLLLFLLLLSYFFCTPLKLKKYFILFFNIHLSNYRY